MSEIPPYYPDWQARQEAEARGQEWAAVAEEALTAEKALRENLRAAEAREREAKECLEFLLREALNGVVCDPNDPCDRCGETWRRVYVLLDGHMPGEPVETKGDQHDQED